MKETLLELKKTFEEIQGSWNGDEAGIWEHRAHAAGEGIEAIDKLIEIIDELND